MGAPTYGAAPLAKCFIIVRAFQLLCFIIILGILGSFINEIIAARYVVAKEIVGTISVTSVATFYILISLPFFWAEGSLTLLVMSAVDSLLLLAFIIVAVVLGKPLSYIDCRVIETKMNTEASDEAYGYVLSVSSTYGLNGGFIAWSSVTKQNCYESKAVWGLCIALCIFFAMTVMVLPALFMKQKRANRAAAAKASTGWGA